MATPKLQTSKTERADAISILDIYPTLPDGRFVIIRKGTIHLTSRERCSCGDHRYKKETCKHMVKIQSLVPEAATVVSMMFA